MGGLALARMETRRQGRRIDPRGMAVVLTLGLALGALFVLSPGLAPDPDQGLYSVKATPGSPLRPAAEQDGRFRVLDDDGLGLDGADLLLRNRSVRYDDGSERSLAALEAYDQALRRWLDKRLLQEADQAAAFPLEITVVYESRDMVAGGGPEPSPTPDPTGPAPTGTGGPGPTPGPTEDLVDAVDPAGEVRRGLRPDDLDPPFPIRSLLLTFAYVLPASLLVQLHASDLHAERIRRRGVLLLAAPLRPAQVLGGKSLPGLVLAGLLAVVVTLALGAGPLGFLASLSFIAFLYAGITLLAVLARSPRELTLLQVAMTTLLNVFLFLPAMFPALPPVAFLSPVHVIASSMRGDPVGLGPFLYATLPLTLSAFALGALAVGFTREEIMFSVRGMVDRLLDALEAVARGRWRTFLAGLLVVPFVFAAELTVLVLSAVLGLQVALVLFLPMSVLVEEVAKGLPVWARARRPLASRAPPWLVGVLVGTGFFVAEKGALVLTLVGFRDLPYGPQALALLGTGPGLALLMAPLLVHVLTSVAMAVGATRGRLGAWAGFGLAVAAHFAYDRILLGVAF